MKNRKYTKLLPEMLELRNGGMSYNNIAKKLNIPYISVLRYLDENLRTRHLKSQKISDNIKKDKDIKYRVKKCLQRGEYDSQIRGHHKCITNAEEIIRNFNGKCKICNIDESNGRLVMDHNHDTGQFRGWLCSNCNSGIGLLKDNIEVLQKAIKYLEDNNDE